MRILLDECIDEALRHEFTGHQCQTCRYAGFKGLANGLLMAAAERAGFEVLITVDQNMPFQQTVANRAISLIVIRGRTTSFEDLVVLMPDILAAIDMLQPGRVVRVGMP